MKQIPTLKGERKKKMHTKSAVAILLVAIFALSSIATIAIKPAKATGGTLTLSDAELMSGSFAYEWNGPPGTFTGKTLVGPGVLFGFTGVGKVGMGDNYPVDPLAGGTGPFNGDFTAYSEYSMLIINQGPDTIQAHLFMNTGWVTAPQDWTYNIFWASSWTTIGPHQSAVLTLDFSSCGEAWGCSHDPNPLWVHPDGTGGFPVQRLDQVSNIGFEVIGGGSASASLLVSGTLTQLYIDPPVVNKAPSDVSSFFDVFVTLSDFNNLAGFDIELTWDSNVITEAGHNYANYLDPLWGSGKWDLVVDHSGVGSYELAAAALNTYQSNVGASVLFKITFQALKSNFPLATTIHFALAKLSDNGTPVPTPIPATVTDGLYTMSATRPDLEFNVLKQNKKTLVYEPVTLPDHFEYGNSIEVQVYVSHISANSPLQHYDITLFFAWDLFRFVDIDVWGELGNGSFSVLGGDMVDVSCTNVTGWYGDRGLLFTATFQVQFAATGEYIWNIAAAPNWVGTLILMENANLGFGALGTIPMRPISGIDTPSTLIFKVYFIRGDVDCNGVVNMADISAVAFWYNHPAADKPEYDLNNDGTIDIYDIVTIATNFGYGLDP